jgi:hypothetical protein
MGIIYLSPYDVLDIIQNNVGLRTKFCNVDRQRATAVSKQLLLVQFYEASTSGPDHLILD